MVKKGVKKAKIKPPSFKDYRARGKSLNDDGSEAIWRESDGKNWTTSIKSGFELPTIRDYAIFNDIDGKRL
jgi:hypothetical protein